ncbi:zinc-binding dehydrogenase [Gimesia maris]|uniref:D-arabitol-phosphate dehydrogenase n=2 Tax=Gimesia maris TaxID=122 RepID=A0ABX5YWF6_9PLAN|nr:zinc-binding dehydrogenase [Gimesia maris]EDL61063.1 probable zinc-type alcohol dehydrogenase [Gimesia maris DSM 8797]QDU17978.1 D-arabitol-phosphate dehydrogenase [Gimesia maris]QEG20015.1 D-arabitol-phosphate dehydrogenase [Gimesia maris]QGQ27192.1 alcohol dehydrogenase catalytic domain-containing protein [Gimesia maris]|tara:strand:- start:109482 stop:110522 length:1041 start_codon:yes stop_codon:yes gene_type:complete
MNQTELTQTAVVNYAPEANSVELQEIPVPEIGPDEVLLEVAAVGVCGSDLHQWTADHSWPVNYPVVLGHEFAGKIFKTGGLIQNWSEGDRVVSETAAIIDPDNPLSREGRYNLDPTRKGFGYGVNGAMTSFVRVPARCLHRVPDSLPLEKAALTEPCCVAFNAVVMNGEIQPGDRIVVFGPGPIGLLCAAMARLQGAEVAVVGLERDKERLEIAERSYGCQPVIEGLDDWAYEVDGLGVNGVVDAAGVSVTLKKSLEIVRPGGWISKVGWGPQPLGFSLDPLVQKNIRLQGSFSHNWPIWERVIRLLTTGQLNIEPIIGGTWSLSEWHTAFETMHSGEIVKAVLTP